MWMYEGARFIRYDQWEFIIKAKIVFVNNGINQNVKVIFRDCKFKKNTTNN